MCGIAGILSARQRQLGSIFAMNDVQAHRGPDGEGFLFVDGPSLHAGFTSNAAPNRSVGQVAFGHRRLAIIDTSTAGLQPMASADQQHWIVFNGEIYNYLELKAELVGLGHTFTTASDTEVLLAAYREWGVDCFARFNGMWSLAIWDHQRSRLVLSRDRFGIKPLHIATVDGGLVFASEIKGVLASGLVDARLNRAVAAQFLRWTNLNTTNDTMFEGIRSFPPGHVAVIDPDDPTGWSPTPFYRFDEEIPEVDLSFDGAADRFRELFLSSVDLRMRSDVPVGSCLSGGLDSSSVVCAASRNEGTALATFTSNFDDPRYSERRWSDLVNEAVGAKPHLLHPSPSDFERDFSQLLTHQEEPFGSTSIFAQWCLMREAHRNNIPVLLDGQGGDEILCGYRKFYMFYLRTLARERRFATAGSELVNLVRHGDRDQWKILSNGSRYLPGRLQSRMWSLAPYVNAEFQADWSDADSGLGLSGGDINDRQIADITTFSIPSLLRYEDRNSMAWSVEARVPFLDHRLVEFAVGLPVEYKLSGGTTKSVLRKGLRGLVPDAILDRDRKLGFTTPMADWMAEDLRPMIESRLGRSGFAASFFDGQQILAEFRDRAPKRDHAAVAKIFSVVAFDVWLEQFGVTT